MTKRTAKVGICRKYGVRYGSSLRKIIKKFEITQHAKYACPFCGKVLVKRLALGIWQCRGCKKQIAGGAWELTTTVALTAKTSMNRIKKLREDAAAEVSKEKQQLETKETQQQPKKEGKKDKKAKKE